MKSDVEAYRLLMRTAAMARRTSTGAEESSEQTKIRHGYGYVLDALKDDRGMSQQEIADAIGIRAQSLSEAISVLEERGFVRREQSECDRRVTLVYITEKGSEKRQELAERREIKAREFFKCLDDGERDTLCLLLAKLSCREETER